MFADLVGFYTHLAYICTFFVAFFSANIDGRTLIFRYKLHIGTPYRGKHFLTRQIPTSCLATMGDQMKIIEKFEDFKWEKGTNSGQNEKEETR
jgi:hypothetical protein